MRLLRSLLGRIYISIISFAKSSQLLYINLSQSKSINSLAIYFENFNIKDIAINFTEIRKVVKIGYLLERVKFYISDRLWILNRLYFILAE